MELIYGTSYCSMCHRYYKYNLTLLKEQMDNIHAFMCKMQTYCEESNEQI